MRKGPALMARVRYRPMSETRLTEQERERYVRQLVLEDWGEEAQAALWDAGALVVGLGGVGSAAATYLAAAGTGRLGLADDRFVALDDVARAALQFTPDVGVGKAPSAAAKLGFLNPDVVLDTYPVRVDDRKRPGDRGLIRRRARREQRPRHGAGAGRRVLGRPARRW